MESPDETIQKAEAAVEEAKANYGQADVRVSYKLDELASVLKTSGRLLEAANASAKAKAIRTVSVVKESEDQAERFGELPDNNKRLSAVGWLKKLHRWAVVASLGVFIIVLFIPVRGSEATTAKNLVGTTIFGVFLQLLMFPIQSIPRIVKWTIVTIGTGAAGMVLFR